VGGGSAGIVQLGTTVTRLTSTATTAGLGNPIIATIENILSIIFSIMSLFLPILLGIGAVLLVMFLGKRLVRRL
jgi:phosphotransferase system  glucose/maltose/N-acetylglucosamine-specific IIC component